MATQSPRNGRRVLIICQDALARLGCWYFTIALRQDLLSGVSCAGCSVEAGSWAGMEASGCVGLVTRGDVVVYLWAIGNEISSLLVYSSEGRGILVAGLIEGRHFF